MSNHEIKDTININMMLRNKTIVIQFESLVGEEKQAQKYALELYQSIESSMIRAKNMKDIITAQSN